ncbi:AAA family ATPase [Natrononativus amylolyticus]|uniref:AAA family ATPase n=1 Tax=Natrononativus amylolyticus TaxID=2963434 RepID=UPI0020CC72A5|nr:AAA family ATPase [Natrononativus amylolyticus]
MSERKRLIVVCGLPGTGKTTVAAELTDRLAGELVRTDVVRKDLFASPAYTAAETRATYDETLSRARDSLAGGEPVVLDGTFRRPALRERTRGLAEDAGARYDLVWVTCREDVVRERIAARNGDASDADFEVYKLLQSEFETPAEAHHHVDNSGTLAETRRQVATLLEAPTPSR